MTPAHRGGLALRGSWTLATSQRSPHDGLEPRPNQPPGTRPVGAAAPRRRPFHRARGPGTDRASERCGGAVAPSTARSIGSQPMPTRHGNPTPVSIYTVANVTNSAYQSGWSPISIRDRWRYRWASPPRTRWWTSGRAHQRTARARRPQAPRVGPRGGSGAPSRGEPGDRREVVSDGVVVVADGARRSAMDIVEWVEGAAALAA